ncbi:MAG TPA: 3-hydroxybutyryl-CoA dehydrogenase [Solirubrobacteraceae bacterium]
MADLAWLDTVGIYGAGFMGTGIAESAARSGLDVILYEPEQAALDGSRKRLETSLGRAVEGEKLTRPEADRLSERVSFSTTLEDLAPAQIVLEAIIEEVEIKHEAFSRMDAALPDARFIASNTSSIPIARLGSATSRPERVLGLHFFSPVPVMKLVEVVVALDTSRETVEAARAFAEQIGKRPIETKDRSGFIVNMLLVPYLMAAVRMYEDGFAGREDIDAGMQLGCGHPMGPLTLCDFIGLDVLYAVCESLYDEFKRDEYAPPPLMKRMVASGRLGRKSGRGFYDY